MLNTLFTSRGRAFMRANYFKSLGAVLGNHESTSFAIVCVYCLMAGSLVSPAFATATPSGSTPGGSFTVFGPKTYVRQAGKPKPVVVGFSVVDPTASYTLKIDIDGSVCKRGHDKDGKRRGDEREHDKSGREHNEGGECINSAEVILNGKQVVGPRDFNRHILQISRPIKLLASNTLSVELHGKPGGVLVLKIIGKRNTSPPQLIGITPVSGPTAGGTAISISGKNFLGGATVRLGGIVATSVTVLNSGNISAVTPSHAPGIVDVSVTNPDGQSALLPGGYQYRLACESVVQDDTVPQITILTPTLNAHLQTESVLVAGSYSGPSNTAVTVNGVVAITDGHHFYVNDVPLRAGANVIRATAATLAGKTAISQTQVNSIGPDVMEVRISSSTGISPLKVQFNIAYRGSAALQSVSADFNGDGVVDLTATDLNQALEFTYHGAGVYQPQFMLVDNTGTSIVRSYVIKVEDVNSLRVTFETTYSYFTRSLVCGDVDLALSFMTTYSRNQYRPVLQELRPFFPITIGNWSPLQPSKITEEYAEFAVNKTVNGINRLFFIYFIRDSDGIWRIDSM